LTLQATGYWTGTLSATEGTTYPFYATAKDSQNQRTSPRLFNIISRHPYPTGGDTVQTVTIGGVSYKIHSYLLAQTGTNFVVTSGARICDILIVAGGGAGGESNGDQDTGKGGGGAGGLLYRSAYSVAVGTYAITVGDGGDGRLSGDGSGTVGNPGGNSTGFSVTANGGGGGAASDGNSTGAAAGGSGGGGGARNSTTYVGAATNQGTFTGWTNRGFGGGTAGAGASSGGGGGGAGGAGGNQGGSGSSSTGGTGGVGYDYSSIFGTTFGESGWFAGGGGGGTYRGNNTVSTYQAPGGNGGGGDGVFSNESSYGGGYTYSSSGASATDNTGGGGGGSAEDVSQTDNQGSYNGWGGSGVVLIRYAA
jgi:hypothetical protein